MHVHQQVVSAELVSASARGADLGVQEHVDVMTGAEILTMILIVTRYSEY